MKFLYLIEIKITIICSRSHTNDIKVQRNSVTTKEPRTMSIAIFSVENKRRKREEKSDERKPENT